MSTPRTNRARVRKAWIAFTAAVACLMIYLLACVMSPPAWSPDSSQIAVLVSPPGDQPDRFALFTYDIAADTHALLDEVKAEGILSAPSWSPDGKWIAYYKVEQPPEETAPSEPGASQPGQATEGAARADDAPTTAEPTTTLSTEDNLMLPSLITEMLEKHWEEAGEADLITVKLIVVSRDGTSRRVLAAMKWIEDGEMPQRLVHMRPVWSWDGQRLFCVHGLGDLFAIGSIELATGRTFTHGLSSIGAPVLSRDGQWIASYLEDENALMAARVDGSLCKYLRLSFEVETEQLWMLDGLFWSKDANRLFVVAEDTTLYAVDAATGASERWIAPDPNYMNGYFTQSATGNTLYFLTGIRDEPEPSEEQTLALEYVDLADKSTRRVFEFRLPEISQNGEGGLLSISPDGKTVLLRAAIKDAFEQEKSALVFLDGKTKKVIMTDRWLRHPLYNDADVIFEDKLIGQWKAEDAQVSITRGTRRGTYNLSWSQDDKKLSAAATLVRVKGARFLGLFTDESVLDKRDASNAHRVPDVFMRVVEMEPKLVLQAIEYDKLTEVVRKAQDTIGTQDFESDDIVELERVGP